MSEQDPPKKIVGKIVFLYGPGGEMEFTSKIDFLNVFRQELYEDSGAIRYKLNSDDPNFRRAVNHIFHTAYGEGESKYLTAVSDETIVKMRDGSFSVRAKLDGKDTGLIPMSSSAVKKYLDRPPEFRQEFLKGYVLTHHFPDSDNKLMQSISR